MSYPTVAVRWSWYIRMLPVVSGVPLVTPIGAGFAIRQLNGGYFDILESAGVRSGVEAFAEAQVTAKDIQYASLYDSFTITVLVQLENLGFCKAGDGGRFVADGGLISGVGKLPVNTDGGGLCNNHPANRGGMTKVIEAVRHYAAKRIQPFRCPTAAWRSLTGRAVNWVVDTAVRP